MKEFVKKSLLLGLGVKALKKSFLDKVVAELLKKGDITEKEGRDLIDELLQKVKERAIIEQARIKELIRLEVIRRVKQLGFVTKGDIERLYGLKVLGKKLPKLPKKRLAKKRKKK